MIPITTRQKQVLDFIDDYVQKNGYPPTYQAIGLGLGLKSLATVAKHVATLIGKGRLKKTYNGRQSLEVVTEGTEPRFVFEGHHHLWDRIEQCYWVREGDRK